MTKIEGSSNIAAIGYEPTQKILHVHFTNGSKYAYHKVQPQLFEQLMKSPSKGSFIHHQIKGRHEVKKVS